MLSTVVGRKRRRRHFWSFQLALQTSTPANNANEASQTIINLFTPYERATKRPNDSSEKKIKGKCKITAFFAPTSHLDDKLILRHPYKRLILGMLMIGERPLISTFLFTSFRQNGAQIFLPGVFHNIRSGAFLCGEAVK